MATSSKRDVRLGVEIETAGEESLRKLASEVRALAREGDAAAPEYARLADELDRLSKEAREIESFARLAKEVETLATASQAAAQRFATLQASLADQTSVTEAARKRQDDLRTSLRQTSLEISEQKAALDLLRNARTVDDAAAVRSAARTKELKDGLANLNAEARRLKIELGAANTEVTAANQALTRLEGATTRAGNAAEASRGAYQAQAAELQRARTAAEALGADLSDLAAAQARLDAALRGSVGTLDEIVAGRREQAEADRLAALEARGLAEAQERGRVAAQSQLAAIKDSEKFTREYAAAVRAAAAAVDDYVDDLDRQNAVVASKVIPNMVRIVEEHEKEQAALRASAAAAELLTAQRREQAEADRLAAIEARGLAEAHDRNRAAALSELAAIKDSEQFTRQYAEAQRDAAKAAAELSAASQAAAERNAALVRDMQEMQRIDDYVRQVADAMAEVERETAAAAIAAQRLQKHFDSLAAERDIVEKAFGATGIRSIQAIEKEMFDLQRALQVVQREFVEGKISLLDFERATGSAQLRLAALKREIETIPGNRSVFDTLADSANNLITKFGALTAAVATVGFAFKPLLDATIALDQTRRILTTVTGSATEAAAQIEFLRNTAQRSGQSFTELAASYSKFAASALQTGLSTQQVQTVFQSVSLAAGNLGLSSDQARRALEALGQIASKGVANMEELRQQLGDALPGVLPLLAKELGLTNQEFNKVVESGRLLASEAIPAVGRALVALQPQSGVVNGITAEWNRFLNIVKEAGTTIVEGPLGKAVAPILQGLATGIGTIGLVAVQASEGIERLGQRFGAFAAFLADGARDWDKYSGALQEALDASNERVRNFEERLVGARTETRNTGSAVESLGKSFSRLALDQQEAIDAADRNAQVAEKLTQARKTESDAVARAIGLSGDDAEAKLGQAAAARSYVEALETQVRADEAVVAAMRTARAETLAAAQARGLDTKAIEESTKKLDEIIPKKEADAEKSRQAAAAARAEAAARDIAAQSVANNAGRYDELSRAVAAALIELNRVSRQFAEGRATAADMERATLALATAKGILKDATSDLVTELDRQVKADRALFELQTATLRLEVAKAQNALAEANRLGQVSVARQAAIKVQELELQLTQLSINAKEQEAAKTIAFLEAQKRQLDQQGLLTPAKQAEIDLAINAAKVKQIEAQTTAEQTKQVEKNVEAMKNGTAEVKNNTAATSGNSSATSTNTKERAANTDEIEKQAKALKSYNDLLRDDPQRLVGGNGFGGFADPRQTGVRNAGGADNVVGAGRDAQGRTPEEVARLQQQGGIVDNSLIFQLRDKLAAGTLTREDLADAERALAIARENARLSNGPIGGLNGMADASMWVQQLEQIVQAARGGSVGAGTGSNLSLGKGSGSGSSAVAQPRTVNISIGGRTTPVTAASDTDADALESVLRQIEDAANRSGG